MRHAEKKELSVDIRTQILPCDAIVLEQTEHGQFFEITSTLTGPNGRTLGVRSVWMTECLSQQTKFITLIPERNFHDET
jgi:hypothetical protein